MRAAAYVEGAHDNDYNDAVAGYLRSLEWVGGGRYGTVMVGLDLSSRVQVIRLSSNVQLARPQMGPKYFIALRLRNHSNVVR